MPIEDADRRAPSDSDPNAREMAGPVQVRRLHKDDGRVLILFERRPWQPAEEDEA